MSLNIFLEKFYFILIIFLFFLKITLKINIHLFNIIYLNIWSTNFYINYLLFGMMFFSLYNNYLNFFIGINFLKFNIFFNTMYKLILNYKLNKLLVIGTISIHPFFFYFFLFSLINYIQLNTIYNFLNKKFNAILIVKYLVFSQILGSLWSLQSITWGYFWVNDNIEWILFSFIIINILLLHSINLKIKSYNLIFFILNFFILIFTLRLSIFSTRHSFFNFQLFQGFYLLYTYLILIAVMSYYNKTKMNKYYYLNFIKILLKIFTMAIILNYTKIIFLLQFFVIFFFLEYLFNKQKQPMILFLYHLYIFTFLFLFWLKINSYNLVFNSYNFFLFFEFLENIKTLKINYIQLQKLYIYYYNYKEIFFNIELKCFSCINYLYFNCINFYLNNYYIVFLFLFIIYIELFKSFLKKHWI